MKKKTTNANKITPKPAVKRISPKKKKTANTKKEDKSFVSEMIGLHNIRIPKGARRKKKLLGRGPSSGHGKTSSRGSKGQTSRAGRDFYLGYEGGQTPLIRRIPKRGFTSIFKKEYQIVNVGQLKDIKETNITLDLLKERGLIKDSKKLVKILGDGEVKSPFIIQAHAFSRKAAELIAAAGGKIEIINA